MPGSKKQIIKQGKKGFFNLSVYSSTVIASVGHEVTHAMHWMHSSLRTGTDFLESGYSGKSWSSKTSTGHMSTHMLSPLHFFQSTLTSGTVI